MNADTRVPQGFHLNIEVRGEPMEMLHINLAKVNGRFVMTIVDRFSKKSWFTLLAATDTKPVA